MSFFSNIRLVADFLDLDKEQEIHFEPTYHKVAQSFPLWPVVIHEDGYKIRLFEWGLIADYMNTPEKVKQYRTSMANARSEKMTGDKRSVWYRLKKQRCLVFSTGFFEHHEVTGLKKKIPYFIRSKDQPLTCFAGLYNYSPLPDPGTGELAGTFAVITRPGNPLLNRIHNGGPNSGRMPLILTPSLAKKWLEPSLPEEEINRIAGFEYPDTGLEAWPVNTIRTRKPDDESVITPQNYPGLSIP